MPMYSPYKFHDGMVFIGGLGLEDQVMAFEALLK